MTFEEMKNKLKSEINEKRYIHSINVMEMAVKLAKKLNACVDAARIAGLLHDCARDIPGEEALRLCKKYGIPVDGISFIQTDLLHGPLGSVIASLEYGVDDARVLKAIYTHTTGSRDMDVLQKIIFIADYIEPGRAFPGVEDVRTAAFEDLDRAMLMALDSTIKYVISLGKLLHPDTISTRNDILLKRLADVTVQQCN